MRSFILLLCLLTALFKTNLAEAYSRTAEHKPGFTKDENLPAARHDGRHFFIRAHALAGQPSQAEIDAAMAASVAQGRIIQVTTGGLSIPSLLKEITSLPVVFRSRISGHDYDIVIMGMRFTPTGATLSIGCRFTLPGNALPGNVLPDSQTNLYFGSNDIAVSGKSGFAGDLPILKTSLSDARSAELDDPGKLLGDQTSFAEFALPGFGSNLAMGLGADSKLSFTCGAFNKFSLSGFVKAYNLVEKETADGKKVADGKPLLLVFTGQQTSDWKDIFIDAKVASAFHAASYPDLGFHFGSDNLAKIDLSTLQNPANLPACAQVSAESWQGIAFPTFKLRLPAFFKLRSSATLAMGNVAPATGKNLFMDAKGLLGSVGAENVYTLKEGYTDEINNYDMSLDNLTANYSCNGQVTASMLGKIAMPWCGGNSKSDAPLLRYSFRYTNNRYEVFVKDTEQGNYGSGPYVLSTGSQLAFNVADSKLLIQTKSTEKPVISADVYGNSVCRDFPAKLSASQCTDKELIWSTGAVGASLEVKPAVTTTYTVKCQDKYCVSASSDSLKITVYQSLPQPALIAGRDAFCRYESTDLSADHCVGKIEWKNPGGRSFDGSGTDQRVQNASFPDVNQVTDFTYRVRCNLNGCLSPETAKTLRVNPEPAAPNLYSNAPNNTIDKNGSVTIGGNCANGDRLVWENLPSGGVPQSTVTLASTSSYSAICRNDATGCQSLSKASITINVLYFPPAAPTNLAFSGAGTNFLTLTWQDNSGNEDGFTILRSTSPTFANAQTVGNVGADIASFHDNGLTEGITYYYQVIAHNRYDNGYSDWASRSTVITPGAPELRADNQNIVKGTAARISGYCGVGNLVWTVPVGYGGGERVQYENTTYWAKCVNEDVEGSGASITVSVYVPTPGAPELSASSTSIVKGGQVNVTGICASGTLVWTVPVGYGGGQRTQNETTTYWAKCVNEGVESGGSSITVSVYVPTPGAPQLSASNTSILKGSKANVFGTCPSGTLVWTAPVGFGGGEWLQQDNVTYWAKCVNEGFESAGVSITVAVFERPVPGAPNLWAQNNNIPKSSNAAVYGNCPSGSLVWTAPAGFNGGERWQENNTEYRAKCEQDGQGSSESSVSVFVYDRPAVTPPNLWVQNNNIPKGSNAAVYGNCPSGNLVWTAPAGFNGGERWQENNTEYRAKCEQDGQGSSESSVSVFVYDRPVVTPPNLWVQNNNIPRGSNAAVYGNCPSGSLVWTAPAGFNGGERWQENNTEYRAKCEQDGQGSSESSVSVFVYDRPAVIPPNLWVQNNNIPKGSNAAVYGNCPSGSLVWTAPAGFNGGERWQENNTEYRAKCEQDGQGSSESSVSVFVYDRPVVNPPNLWAQNNNIPKGSNAAVYGNCPSGSLVWTAPAGFNGGERWQENNTEYRAKCEQDGRGSSESSVSVFVYDRPVVNPPNLWVQNNNIPKGSNAAVYGNCLSGNLVWTAPTGFNSGERWQENNTEYRAKCVQDGQSSSESSVSVFVYDRPVVNPPNLWAQSNNIPRGSNAAVYGNCPSGSLVWTAPAGFNGGERWQENNTEYRAKCEQDGQWSSESSVSVFVYDRPVVSSPNLWAQSNNIPRGSNAAVYGNCPSGNLVWTVPTGFNSGERWQENNTEYRAKCVQDGQSSSESSVSVFVYDRPVVSPPNLWAQSNNIPRGGNAAVYGNCPLGNLVWTAPAGFNGGERWQENNTEYRAKCEQDGQGSSESSVSVFVYDRPVVSPPSLWAERESILRGSSANVYGNCISGSLVWTSPANFTGGVHWQGGDTEYRAKCVQEGQSSGESALSVVVYDRAAPGPPTLWAQSSTISPGSNASVYGTCTTGNLVWTSPAGFNGGERRQDADTEYRAKCVQLNQSSAESSVMVAVVRTCNLGLPVVIAPSEINKNDHLTLIAKGCPAGSSYNWSPLGESETDDQSSFSTYYSVSNTAVYSVSCTFNGCSSGNNQIRVTVKEPTTPDPPKPPVDKTPNWQPQGSGSCPNGPGVLWKDMNPNSPTGGLTRCCRRYRITPISQHENDTWRVEYTDCNGNSASKSGTSGANPDSFWIEAISNTVGCSGCEF